MTAAASDAIRADVADALRAYLGDETVEALETADGIAGALVAPERWAEAAGHLRNGLGFTRFVDLTCADTLADEGRFAVYLLAYHMETHRWARIKTHVDEELASLGEVYAAALPYEREVFDLYGVRFQGHPALTRLLLPDEWSGHPLRRDVPLVEEPVEFVTTRGPIRGGE